MIFLYDNSIEGFLACVFEAYKRNGPDTRIMPSAQLGQIGFEESVFVRADGEKAERVMRGVLKRTGSEGWDGVLRVFRTAAENKDTVIYNYLRLVFEMPEPRTASTMRHGRILSRFNDPHVIAFAGLLGKFNFETHRFLGFTRFRETASGALYAPIAPDHDILDYIMPHFADRLIGAPFGIFDTNRHLLGLYDGKTYRTGYIEASPEIELTQNELAFQTIWKRYYDDIAIEERKSERRRRGFMPVRYWKYMPEITNDWERT